MSHAKLLPVLALLSAATAVGCGGESDEKKTCSLADPVKTCEGGRVCEEAGGQPVCVAALVVRGRVTDPAGMPIAGALVTALDGNDAPATGTATTGADGSYELRVPTTRDDKGTPLVRQVKLRAAAAGFETFPAGLRRSLPLELSAAQPLEGKLVYASSGTTIVLEPIAGAAALGSIAGVVQGAPGKRGVLVVAEGPAAVSGISDADGAYVIFNVPAGAYTVRGYAAGVQLAPAKATVAAGARAAGVDLAAMGAALGAVSGTVSIVNAPGGSMTSVVLVVASTFNEALKRGSVPPGLRAPRAGAPVVSGAFTITDVPDGAYVVLAAFENDGLVRDPDTAIGGTQIQRVTLAEGSRQATLPAGFKITEALSVMSPGAGETLEAVTGTPTFVWKDDSSEDRYALEVIDGKGRLVWSNNQVARATGGSVSLPYGGPPLTRGELYQFRVTSFRRGDVPISQTEDLRGVFLAQ
jgi:hypothetical protein